MSISGATDEELSSCFTDAVAGGGVAKLVVIMRVFDSEGKLAETLSAALGKVPSIEVDEGKEWRFKLSLASPEEGLEFEEVLGNKDSTLSTCFKMMQRPLSKMSDSEKFAFMDTAAIVGENICDSSSVDDEELQQVAPVEPVSLQSAGPLPSSIFMLQFPVVSTSVVVTFLESRLPGVVFLTYKRDEGMPQLDNVVFGPEADSICSHSLAMRVKEDPASPFGTRGSCMFGFDLRLVKGLEAQPVSDELGVPSLVLGALNDKVLQWWKARNALLDRVRAFTGIEPATYLIDLVGEESETTIDDSGHVLIEGTKKTPCPETSTAPSSRDTSASSPTRSITHQPDLKDENMLLQCRSVIVDLGNACWTHRHFSEDIQTRQYRAPEVIIGSKYDASADIWSLGCMTFELLTGDLLFDPRAGEDYDRDEDHLAMFQELLGKMPKRVALEGKYSKNFFDKRGNLKHIKQLKFWPVQEVLVEKYHFPRHEAQEVADFMTPLLDFDPKTRATALEALDSPWLRE